MEIMNNDALSQAIVKLLESERFYAEIISQMDRVITTHIPVAGVCIKDKIELHVNIENFSKFTVEQRVAILKHECQHLLRDHIARSKELAPEVYGKDKDEIEHQINKLKHQSINVAADLAINDQIRNLPEDSLFSKNFGLPAGRTMEWYFNEMKNNEYTRGKLKEFMEFDDHAIWAESESDKDILREKVKRTLEKAAKKARAAGNMSADDELALAAFNYKPKDWKSDLKRFAAKSTELKVETSKKKRNRRYGILYPGSIKVENLTIGVAIDTSGSVPEIALNQFMAEIGNIAKHAKVIVVDADTEVKQSYIYDPKKKHGIKGRGGTAYQPALDYFSVNFDIDGLIYFGDMDCWDQEEIKKPKYPVLWAVFGEQEPPVKWGSKTKIEIRSKS